MRRAQRRAAGTNTVSWINMAGLSFVALYWASRSAVLSAPFIGLKSVLLVDPNPRQVLPPPRQLVAAPREFLLRLEQVEARGQPVFACTGHGVVIVLLSAGKVRHCSSRCNWDQGRWAPPHRLEISFSQNAEWKALISKYITTIPFSGDACCVAEQSISGWPPPHPSAAP